MLSFIFEISDLNISLSYDSEIKITDSFLPFLKNDVCNDNIDYFVNFQEIAALPQNMGTLIGTELDYNIYLYNGLIQRRVFYNRKNNKPYAMTEFNFMDKEINVRYLPEGKRFVSETGNSFFHIGWEKILLNEGRINLHAACIETDYGGILFSGPSGVGKSTQASLWCNYESASLINGDRVILKKSNSKWFAYGSPYAGSSKCYINDKCSVKAIVILKQASMCRIRSLSKNEAFRRIYEGLTINSWDKKFVERAFDMTINIISEIPIYEMECSLDKSSIDILKMKLGW